MRIGIQNISIAPQKWQSERDLKGFLERDRQAILVGAEAENPKEYYSISVSDEPQGKLVATVGLLCDGHGILPEVLAVPDSGLLFVGANSGVTVVSWKHRAIITDTDLGFLFRSFIPGVAEGMILAAHETGAAAFSTDGKLSWQFHRDIVEELCLDGFYLQMTFMDADAVRVDIRTGREL